MKSSQYGDKQTIPNTIFFSDAIWLLIFVDTLYHVLQILIVKLFQIAQNDCVLLLVRILYFTEVHQFEDL